MILKETFQKARSDGFALGAFNVSTLVQVKAVVGAAQALASPVILEISPGEAEFLGIEVLAAVRDAVSVRSASAPANPPEENRRIPQPSRLESLNLEGFSCGGLGNSGFGESPAEADIFLNLDHARELESIRRALAAGFDMVHFDGSDLSFEENIQRTREVVELAHREGALVEGEIDRAGGHSVLKGGVGEKVLTGPKKAVRFVSETGVDILACFFGNLHGVYDQELALDLEHLSKIKESVDSYLSLHGGSGVREADIRKAVEATIVKVNVNTELRLAWSDALRKSLEESPEEIVPYRILAPVVDSVGEVVEKKIRLLSG